MILLWIRSFIFHLSGGKMLGCSRSEFAGTNRLMHMNEELSGKLDDLGRKIDLIVNEIKAQIAGKAAESTEDDRVHSAGC